MCLKQTEDTNIKKTKQTGQLCVDRAEFLEVEDVKLKYDANGFVGLGPFNYTDDTSFVYQLYKYQAIDDL